MKNTELRFEDLIEKKIEYNEYVYDTHYFKHENDKNKVAMIDVHGDLRIHDKTLPENVKKDLIKIALKKQRRYSPGKIIGGIVLPGTMDLFSIDMEFEIEGVKYYLLINHNLPDKNPNIVIDEQFNILTDDEINSIPVLKKFRDASEKIAIKMDYDVIIAKKEIFKDITLKNTYHKIEIKKISYHLFEGKNDKENKKIENLITDDMNPEIEFLPNEILKHFVIHYPLNKLKLAENIKSIRESKNISQYELGIKTGIEKNRISEWERGVHEPSFSNVAKMAAVLGVSLDEFSNDIFYKTKK